MYVPVPNDRAKKVDIRLDMNQYSPRSTLAVGDVF